MLKEHKDTLKQLSKENYQYFEIAEGLHPELLRALESLLCGEDILLTINKACYLLQNDTYDYVGYHKVTFTNIQNLRTVNLHKL